MATETGKNHAEKDLEAVRERYRLEREKRLRAEGEDQYLKVENDLAEFSDVDPYGEPVDRPAISEEIETVVLGGGFAGLHAGANLKHPGLGDFRIIDAAGDFGGTWYWNRYPGVQCDIDSCSYLPLLEETGYVPKDRYSYGPEIFAQCQRVGRHYDLYEKALFHTRVTSLVWDEAIGRWHIETDRGDHIRARFLIMAIGPYNRPKLPGIPGIADFKGHSFHTSRWDYDYTGGGPTDTRLDKLSGKRVAVIGTGATAIQVVPQVANWAEHLYVFQRTPSVVDERRNGKIDEEWAQSQAPGWARRRRENLDTVVKGLPFDVDEVSDGWTVISRRMKDRFAEIPPEQLTPEKHAELMEVEDFRLMSELRERVDAIVKDPETAEKLKPWYRWNCKRPTFSDDYLPTFNRPNVSLIDVSENKGVDSITERGIVANGMEYEVDCIIFASGFEITTELQRRMGIPVFTGRDGISLYDHWKDGFRTLHGCATHGFPNLFFTGFTQGGVHTSLTHMYDDQTAHIAYLIRETVDRGCTTIEVSEQGQEDWVRHVRETAFSTAEFYAQCTPGYYNNEGGDVYRSHYGDAYGPGYTAFTDILQEWRDAGDLKGFTLTASHD